MSSPDEFLQIDTPENVVFGYEVAGIGSRFMAAMVDHAAILVMQVVVYLIVVLVVIGGGETSGLNNLSAWVVGALGLVSFVLLWGYYILFETIWNGQTPGKRLMKLRVIRVDGTPITLVEALIRNLARFIDFLPVTYGIGIVTMFINSQSRRLGDLAAGTLVVFDRSEITLESLRPPTPAAPRPLAQVGLPAGLGGASVQPASPVIIPPAPGAAQEIGLPVERLTERDASMIEDYLRRRREISGRTGLARQIAETVHKRMEIPYQPMNLNELDAWLARVVTAYRQRGQ